MAPWRQRGESLSRLARLVEQANLGRPRGLEELLEANRTAHAELLRLLTHLEFEEGDARAHWRAILERRRELERQIGRNASIQLAALDYFQNVHAELRSPKIVEMSTFLATEQDAITDGLTRLHNRQFFDANLRRELKRARRYRIALSLVMLDLDDFKTINDRYGHIVGDEALTLCSQVIQASVREIDVACRYGGEEFALILPETSRTGAYIVSERIRADVRDVFHRRPIGGIPVSLSVSGGIAIYPTDSHSADGLLRMADRALYRSKHEGKDRITLHADEKRRSPRLDSRNVLIFREPRSHPRTLRSETRNLSRDGALVESRIPLPVGTDLDIHIHLPRSRAEFFLRGRVVRLEEAPHAANAAKYEVGVAFVTETDEEARRLEDLATAIYRPLESRGGDAELEPADLEPA